MYRISCPWCGDREQWEFKAAGEGHIRRPTNPSALSDAEWADYVFMRKNPRGVHFERWVHAHGCRRWFHLARDTATDAILKAYGATEAPPQFGDNNPPALDVGYAEAAAVDAALIDSGAEDESQEQVRFQEGGLR